MVTHSQLATVGCGLAAVAGSLMVAGTSGYLFAGMASEPSIHLIHDMFLFMFIVFLLALSGFAVVIEDVIGVNFTN